MKCLVTGASGFIGSHLVQALEARGDEVTKIQHKQLFRDGSIDFIGRLTDIDYIFHLAAYGQMFEQVNMWDIFQANLEGTFRLLTATKDTSYKAFVNVSTSSVLLPHQTMYSATKAGAEALCKAFVDEYNKPIVTVRPFSVYGPGEADFRFIPTVFNACFTGTMMNLVPDAVHDWVYVDDFVAAMIEMAQDAESQKGQAVNIGTGIKTTNKAVVEQIETITGEKAMTAATKSMRAYDTDNWYAGEGDYICPTTLNEGLRKYYESIK